MTTPAKKSFLMRALTEHIGLKLVALVASVGLFVIVRGTEDAQISISVDVVALLPPPSTERMLVSEIPDEIRVTLRGSRSVLLWWRAMILTCERHWGSKLRSFVKN